MIDAGTVSAFHNPPPGGDDEQNRSAAGQTSHTPSPSNTTSARAFFDDKKPTSKNEEFAIAARFVELQGRTEPLKRPDFVETFSSARRDFTASQFARDIDNARKSGFFNSGGNSKRGYTLSHYGQDYVDKLPDREAARKLKPGRKVVKRARPKKKKL